MPAAAKISAAAGMGGTPLWITIVVMFVLVVLLLGITAWRRGWFKIGVKLSGLVDVKLELDLREKTP